VNARLILCVVIALAYGAWRLAPRLPSVVPAPTPPASAPFQAVAELSARLNAEDRDALKKTYSTLSKAVAADPASDPVFIDTAAVRRSHRAALLFVWKGVLSNKTGEVEGLKDALEQAVNARIGNADIPMNPQLKADAAKAFADIDASIQ
jgi:hypothetical protein